MREGLHCFSCSGETERFCYVSLVMEKQLYDSEKIMNLVKVQPAQQGGLLC